MTAAKNEFDRMVQSVKDGTFCGRREALARLRDNRSVNDSEYAYSPSTQAVGVRHSEGQIFRVFNVGYPMYGRNKEVTDWVSVGKGMKTT